MIWWSTFERTLVLRPKFNCVVLRQDWADEVADALGPLGRERRRPGELLASIGIMSQDCPSRPRPGKEPLVLEFSQVSIFTVSCLTRCNFWARSDRGQLSSEVRRNPVDLFSFSWMNFRSFSEPEDDLVWRPRSLPKSRPHVEDGLASRGIAKNISLLASLWL